MSAREEENGEWRRHTVCHDIAWVRELCRGIEDIPFQISRSEYRLVPRLHCPIPSPSYSKNIGRRSSNDDINLNNETDWDETQSARNENQPRPASSGGYGGPVGGTANNATTGAATGFVGQPSDHAPNDILGTSHTLDGADEHNGAGYGYPSAVSTGHNGIGGENY